MMSLHITALCLAVQLLGVAIAQDCTCDCKWKPVCGVDSNTYTNACIATCQGIAIARNGVCAGGPPAKPSSIREDCTANMELMNAFQGEGFVFVGRESFKQRTGPPAAPQNIADNPGKPSAEDLAAFRITNEGYTYTSSSKRGGGPSFPGYTKTDGHFPGNAPPPHARRNLRDVLEGQQIETVDGSLEADERDLAIFGTDTRTQITPTNTVYPYELIGKLIMTISSSPSSTYGCSGALVSSTSVLTAGHCVHQGAGGAYYNSVNFVPALDGFTAPYGIWSFKYLTVFGGWRKSSNLNWDMAVITYNPNEHGLPGDYIGWMGLTYPGLSTSCTLPPLTTGGYPGDKPYGTQWSTACSKIKFKCDAYIGKTACDITHGQSGSPVYDAATATFDIYGVVSFELSDPTRTTNYLDSEYGLYYNGFNLINSVKWPSITSWIFKA